MTDIVPADQIEHIVGAKRHATLHLARAVSSNQTVYILHSHQCLTDARRFGRDLRECPFSQALDEGIDIDRWTQDEPRGVVIEDGRLVAGEGTPSPQHDCGHTCCDERNDPMHDHFLAADNCPSCVGGTP